MTLCSVISLLSETSEQGGTERTMKRGGKFVLY